MTTKTKAISAIVLVISAFAAGRFSCPVKVVTQIHTVEVEKKTKDTDKDTTDHKTVTIIQKPDGSKETVIHDDKDTHSDTHQTDDKQVTQDLSKLAIKEGSRVTIQALGAVKVNDLGSGPLYGALVSKTIFGPISIGAWGLSNATVGIAVGLNF